VLKEKAGYTASILIMRHGGRCRILILLARQKGTSLVAFLKARRRDWHFAAI
jgi:hypothetical protein